MSQHEATGPVAPIAIVGLSCRLPGSSNSPEKLWELLSGADDAWSPVPPDRYNETAFHHPSSDYTNGTTHQRGGYFIDIDLGDFDNAFFRLSPQQAAAMDPQLKILLEMSYEALESAGWALEMCAGSKMGVYTASFTADFELNLCRDPVRLPTYYLTGVERAMLSNRISHAFDLHGPSMTIDTACSGGLVAVHQACQSLRSGECDSAIVASANLTMGPDQRIGMSRLHLLSGSGRCHPFDSRGDGYGRGEGCVVLVLKPLEAALRDRDPVRAILVNTGVNQDGYTPGGITSPNSAAQEQLIRDTYRNAGLSPLDVSYVEAHGTGTKAGDLAETTAISKVFLPHSVQRSAPLVVGSMKGHIGHTENTSGLASLLKAVLMLQHLEVPGTAGLEEFKSNLPLDGICIPRQLMSWPQGDRAEEEKPPRVSVNSFGFGGTNAHAILEPAPGESRHPGCSLNPSDIASHLFPLSGNSQQSLKSLIASFSAWIQQHPDVNLEDLSYTLCHRRSIFDFRYNCVADTYDSLLDQLQAASDLPLSSPPRDATGVVFVFTGQGAQWLGMARELLLDSRKHASSVFHDSIRQSRDVLLELGADWDLEQELLSPPTQATRLNTAQLAQPVTTAVQIALVSMLRAFNVTPGAVVGHSSGEIAAAYAAGYVSAEDALRTAYHRGFMADAVAARGLGPGAMLSVGLGESDAAVFTKDLTSGVAGIACVNSPRSVTISGDAEAVDEVALRIEDASRSRESSIFCRRLTVDTAYHSHHMRAVADDYRARLPCLEVNGQELGGRFHEVTFISSVSGTYKSDGFGPEYWTSNLVSPVRFSDAVHTLATGQLGAGFRHNIFVEIGPHMSLAGPVRQCLTSLDLQPRLSFDYYSVLQRRTDAIKSTLNLASRLFECGVDVDLKTVSALSMDEGSGAVLTNLPAYKWDHCQEHYFESRISREYRMRQDPYHDLLGVRAMDSTSIEPRWRHMIGLNSLPWLAHHLIDHQPIFPGSGYICMAIEGIRQIHKERYPEQELEVLSLRKVSFLRGLVVPEIPGQQTEAQLSLIPRPDGPLAFDFRISAFWDGEWREHCTGVISGTVSSAEDGNGGDAASQLAELASALKTQASPTGAGAIIDPTELYSRMAEDGNKYGPAFSIIQNYTLAANHSSAFAAVKVPDTAAIMPGHHQQPHLIHPATLDAVFHTCLPIVADHLGRGSMVPVRIEDIVISATSRMPSEPEEMLHVAASIRTRQHRTAKADVCATAKDIPVLVASGIQLRSLAPQSTPGSDLQLNEKIMSHNLAWAPDVAFLRNRDLSPGCDLQQLITHILYKHGKATVLELGTGQADLALALLGSVRGPESTWPSYEYACAVPEKLAKVRQQLLGYRVQFHVLFPEQDICEQDFKPHTFDMFLASGLEALSGAHLLLKESGTIVVALKAEPDYNWAENMRQAQFEVQLSTQDSTRDRFIIVARPASGSETENLPLRIQILTHSRKALTRRWVVDIEHGLRENYESVSRDAIQNFNSSPGIYPGEKPIKTCFVVIEDEVQPILSDPNCFDAAMSLLRQSSKVVWLSPSEPLSMHQITGVGRTAHAENDELCLTTIHHAPQLLSTRSGNLDRLLELLRAAIQADGRAREREYQVSDTGIIAIPRVLPDESLDHAIRCGGAGHCEVMRGRFLDGARVLTLPGKEGKDAKCGMASTIFHASGTGRQKLLANNEVELEARSFLLSKSSLKRPGCAYSGVITRVGVSVSDLRPGDQVLAIGTSTGCNRLIVSEDHVAKMPPYVLPAAGARMLFSAMEAFYALQSLARITSKGRALVHGALTAAGRATVAVARYIGATVYVSTTGPEDARQVTEELGVLPDLVVPLAQNRPSRKALIGSFDVIVTSMDELPAQLLSYLKPFGSVVVLDGGASMARSEESRDSPSLKLSRNSAIYSCDILELLRERADLAEGLVAEAAAAMSHLPLIGFDYCVRPIHQISKALQLIETGACDSVVLEAGQDSEVMVALDPQSGQERFDWKSEKSSYLIAGGLGDLGRRLLRLMAQRGARHLITLSRHPCNINDYRQLQHELQSVSPDCALYCLPCNITKAESVQEAAACIRNLGLPPIKGVIQSAALLNDLTLDSMTYEDFARAASVKVEGTLELEKTFASPGLAFFFTLSSAVNILGASGQANYNAGNSVQDALSQTRRGTKCAYMSLSPGWINDAVFTSGNESRLNGLRRAGLRPISTEELTRYFEYALDAVDKPLETRPAQAALGFDTASIADTTTHNGTVHSPVFCRVRSSALPKTAGLTTSSLTDGVATFSQAMAADDPDLMTDIIASSLVTYLSRLISIDTSRIDRYKTSTLDLGVDSLISIELRNWVAREFSAPLQSSEILVSQTINSLTEKIVSRIRIQRQMSMSQDSSVEDDAMARTPATTTTRMSRSASSDLVAGEVSNTIIAQPQRLTPLPQPNLKDVLDLFQRSREAVDSTEQQNITADAVLRFLEGPGPSIHGRLAELPEQSLSEAYERKVYLERREPLQDYSTFILVHPASAPSHSQTARAAILTIAALEFSRQISSGELTPDELHGAPLDSRYREWLFNATRRPGPDMDRMERFPRNQNIVVLRRGHVFEMAMPRLHETIELAAIHGAYKNILAASEERQTDVSSLTADDRESWAHIRSELERHPEGSRVLAAIDSCAFVVCLDDEAPTTGGERFTQFLLNGPKSRLSNRWYDKPFQLAIGANGASAGIYEHTKLDGIDVRSLHHHLTEAIYSHPVDCSGGSGETGPAQRVEALTWRLEEAHIRQINQIQLRGLSYGPIAHDLVRVDSLGSDFLRARRAPSNATAHLAVLLAMYLVDRETRPAWEVVSLATFRRGRIDWVQTVTPQAKEFVERAAAAAAAAPDEGGGGTHEAQTLRALFDAAAASHSRLVSSAAQGSGYVRNLYALLAGLEGDNSIELPELFRTPAWDATRRGGPGQDLKIGFMPAVGGEQSDEWDEGGFLMEGRRGVYVHCAVGEGQVKFSVSARLAYAALVCKELRRACDFISTILRS